MDAPFGLAWLLDGWPALPLLSLLVSLTWSASCSAFASVFNCHLQMPHTQSVLFMLVKLVLYAGLLKFAVSLAADRIFKRL